MKFGKDETENKMNGVGNVVAGKAKNAAGAITGDTDLQGRGKTQETGGKIQYEAGKLQGKIKEGIADVSEVVERAGQKLKDMGKSALNAGKSETKY